ncbi:hypothetical protein ASD24_24535 [Paenibacillus sp. Root52]|uniref:hypothetical protein n=1 Tax=Paenibacillus sp. Root52 TaxID=1736552 RepID=UPI0006F3C826|nr:hypothetical protein [Paenibacillus sp. Root52]KQY90967.1 hypothetical protein ASD24_24535 [Paenibacillus sp. Root52]
MFSRATITDVLNLAAGWSNSQLDTFMVRYGLNHAATGSNRQQKATNAALYLIENPNLPGVIGDNLQYEIVEHIINRSVQSTMIFDSSENEFIEYPQLRRLLLRDGFVIEDNKLIRTFDTTINYSENQNLLESLLDKHGLVTAKGHYEQARENFNRGHWAACNGQLRSYVEELCNVIAEKITHQTYTNSHQAKIALSQTNPPIFYRELNEWKDDGKGYFETFWSRLHPEGSHPGLSNEEDSIFRLNLVQISSLEILRRYDINFT